MDASWHILSLVTLLFQFLVVAVTVETGSSEASYLQPPSESEVIGFECGNVIFYKAELLEALGTAMSYKNSKFTFPQKYDGSLYGDPTNSDFLLWPLKKGRLGIYHQRSLAGPFRLVFKKDNGKIAGVLSKINELYNVKCIKKYISDQDTPSPFPLDRTNGYQCGEKFFPDEIIHKALKLAQKQMGNNPEDYPSPYVGRLYPVDRHYWVWPIYKRHGLFIAGRGTTQPYFLVITKDCQLIEVVARGYQRNHLRCQRSRNSPEAVSFELQSETIIASPEEGYQCKFFFFSDKVVREALNAARGHNKNLSSQFPAYYEGPFCDGSCLVWPIMLSGPIYQRGKPGPFRLLLTQNFELINVVMSPRQEFKPCHRKVKFGWKNHDLSSYQCPHLERDVFFSSEELIDAAENACPKIYQPPRYLYPAEYSGPDYGREGPYLTFPISKSRPYITSSAGNFRVVINTDCEVVGALSTVFSTWQKKLVKCHRLDDGPAPIINYNQLDTPRILELRRVV